IKEGLSEYFVFTIEGTETIQNGWSKRLRAVEAAKVPLKIQYRYRQPEYGDQLVRMYLMTNDKDSKLGATPLPDGVVRVFRDNGSFRSRLAPRLYDYQTVEFTTSLDAGKKSDLRFELVTKQGRNAHQTNVTLENADVNAANP